MGWDGFMEVMTGEARAAPRTSSHLLSVGVAAIVVIEVDEDAELCPDAAQPRQEGARALGAEGQHVSSAA
jgi:hypothetical protein